jgi:hypothetical protein
MTKEEHIDIVRHYFSMAVFGNNMGGRASSRCHRASLRTVKIKFPSGHAGFLARRTGPSSAVGKALLLNFGREKRDHSVDNSQLKAHKSQLPVA